MTFRGRQLAALASAVAANMLAGGFAADTASAAARLKPYVEITGSVVHLSDLFSGLDPGQDVQLGAAPAPGSQLVIRAAQLGAIADEFGVTWDGPRDGVSTTLLRRGHRIDVGSVTAKLHETLLAAGIDAKSIVTLDRFTSPMVDDSASIAVEPPELDAMRRKFRTVLRATCGQDEVLAMDLTGSIETAIPVVVPVRAIKTGEIIAAEDVTITSIAESKVPANAAMRIDEVAGEEARMPLTNAMPIAESMLRRANLVHKGSPVAIHLVEGGIDIAAQGTALGSGALQDRVPVLNPSSRAVLFGWVIGDSEVRVDPGTRPTTPSPNMMMSYGTMSQ